MDHNKNFKSTNRRRGFLKELSKQLCMPAIEIGTSITKLVGNYIICNAMKMLFPMIYYLMMLLDVFKKLEVVKYVKSWITNNGNVEKFILFA